jgi:Flp pilus assembly pilin Flp
MILSKRKNLRRQRAASLIEYSLLIALISLVGVASVRTVGNNINQSYAKIGNALAATGSIICNDTSPTYPDCLND